MEEEVEGEFYKNFGKTGAGDEKKSHSLLVLIYCFPF